MDLHSWIGREEVVHDLINPAQALALAATLDVDDSPLREGDPLPVMWHWIYCTPKARQSDIAIDGHPRKGGFLPPVPLPRRMFAGAKLEIREPIRLGARVEKTSKVLDIREKQGRSGPLVFVQVHHEYRSDGKLNITDRHDIVYREAATASVPTPTVSGRSQSAPDWAAWSKTIIPDPVLLFRYSALIFVSHRIHYDRPYTTSQEGYPGLLVHGPLIATLLAELARENLGTCDFRAYAFRAKAPLFDIQPFEIFGGPGARSDSYRLSAIGADGTVAMEAEIETASQLL